ncbi:type I restriction endonuclease subunit R [Psychroflexus sp. ALD_RP9]|uniref:type I restriction endonuclease subunit R n=1 Tax=Psychroflexus sp. ALD_RP9 TaxID=2777186 RepID=UPI001A8CCB54|nr:type I restriction endonuclease subunit R [Psychroflexus sp. ALD_RP9]QSS96917.1 type I restriction endonuclease subunit R [Psychroflexus sp. ALD_RP9]
MTRQSEAALEEQLLKQLQGLGYQRLVIKNEAELLANLKQQLEKHNGVQWSSTEFQRVLNILNKGSVFERSKLIRQKQQIELDNGDIQYFDFLNTQAWCKNQFQVTHQITINGKYENRYDVTILINGLPLVQIELKRRGCEMAEAHRQILRYKSHSFGSGSGLFQLVQLFVISNGVNTKYFANNRLKALNFKQTFYWAKEDNSKITQLSKFADCFLEPCQLSKFISQYIVLAETDRILMALRPYQYYATEKLIDRVKKSNKNGYIWHTTGSGKTLTSFKASQIIKDIPEVTKVVFVVDRRDLDYQTTKEFNSFSDGSVDGTDNTKALVKQFGDDTKLMVTTIQKLNNAIMSKRYETEMQPLKDKKMVFIFDECHRSQFGETHNRITKFFNKVQLFGFTGTPIFADNAIKNQLGKRTTTELFGDCLHKYVITDAIRDENVLKFSVEYVGRYKQKAESSLNFIDIDVEDIDTKEVLESEDRIDKIANYIIKSHPVKTHHNVFTAMLCVSSIDALKIYYEAFKRKKEEGLHNLSVATIFSYEANQELDEADGDTTWQQQAAEPRQTYYSNNREALDAYLEDYNHQFKTKFSTKSSQDFYNYYNDVAKRVKDRKIDLLIVVNMFLTGFDSKHLNTLYVDKNLKYHGLIQAYSRTNRIINKQKSHGNIVVFRNLKEATDEAIALFSNKEAKDTILMEPYEDYISAFEEAFAELKAVAPTVDSVNELASEIEEEQFVKRFRALMRVVNALSTFSDFNFADLEMDEQTFEDYKSKYLDIYQKTKEHTEPEKASILNDVDFEIELMHKDEINVAYILNLLAQINDSSDSLDQKKKRQQISDILSGDLDLRSKKELIEKFIDEQLIGQKVHNVQEAFDAYWSKEQRKAFKQICEDEQLKEAQVEKIIEEKLFAEEVPALREKVRKAMKEKQSILVRKKSIPRIIDKINEFITTFIEGMAA